MPLTVVTLAFRSESDRSKFEYVYAKYKNLMLYKAYGILRDRMLAEDAVSEAYIRIFKNIGKIEDPASGKAVAFVVTIARNCALTLLEQRGRGAADPIEDEMEADGQDVEEIVLSELSAAEIMRIVDQLGDANRDLFLLKFAYGLPHREIGKMLGETENNITVRLHRIKKKLCALLREKGYARELETEKR
ncbi:MAG: sigma-70 family RNA polymerase sigma factor [Clostridiales bacterium]|jgi:RNA polymerase sigma-70 factor (ECF subfamily)|nr:sigma-70 family RNA polymerase sigma factor [Clostridiales bacterium]